MTVRRAGYTPTNVLRFLQIFDELIKSLKEQRPNGAFLTLDKFPGMQLTTLQNRFTDALKWLRDNVDNPAQVERLKPYVPSYRQEDYELLRVLMKTRIEANGLRVMLLAGHNAGLFVRDTTNPEIGQPKPPADWKTHVQNFLSTPDKIGQIKNCEVTEDNKQWLDKIVHGAGFEYYLNGDTLTLLKP